MNIIFPTKKGIYIKDGKGIYFVPFPIYSVKKSGNLRNRSMVMGFVGPNGSGKSVNAARELAIGYMIPGKPVFSNMEIGFWLIKDGEFHLRTTIDINRMDIKNLAEVYQNCAILYDEVNVDVAEARRAMSDINLKVMYIVQQKRKRNLDIVWSAVSEMDIDVRLRSRTDVFVKCKDLSLLPGFSHRAEGEKSSLTYYDYSGMVVPNNYGKGEKAIFHQTIVWNKPWWNIFETGQIQMPGNIVTEDDTKKEEEADDLARRAAVIIGGIEGGRISRLELWRYLKVKDHSLMTAIGGKLSKYGVIKSGPRSSYYMLDPEYDREFAKV